MLAVDIDIDPDTHADSCEQRHIAGLDTQGETFDKQDTPIYIGPP